MRTHSPLVLLLIGVIAVSRPDVADAHSVATPSRSVSEIPIGVFVHPPQFSELKISPSGDKVASVHMWEQGGVLEVFDLNTNKLHKAATFSDADVARAFWTSDVDLVIEVRLPSAAGKQEKSELLLVRFDGSKTRRIQYRSAHLGDHYLYRVPSLPTNEVLVEAGRGSESGIRFFRMGVESGEFSAMFKRDELPSIVVKNWLPDKVGEIRFLAGCRPCQGAGAVFTWWMRQSLASPWQEIHRASLDESARVRPFQLRDRTISVSVWENEESKLMSYDPSKRTFVEFIETDPEEPARIALQKLIDRTLPTTKNWLASAPEQSRYQVVTARSLNEFGTHYVFDRQARTLEVFARARPWLPAALMSERKEFVVTHADKTTTTSLLTIPKFANERKSPLVVLVPDGLSPFDYAAPNDDSAVITQLFASRGMAVLEVVPRLPRTLRTDPAALTASMVEDLASAIEQVVATGSVDGARICLEGLGRRLSGIVGMKYLEANPSRVRCAALTVPPLDFSASSPDRLVADLHKLARADSAKTALERQRAPTPEKLAKVPMLLAIPGGDKSSALVLRVDHARRFAQGRNDVELHFEERRELPRAESAYMEAIYGRSLRLFHTQFFPTDTLKK